MLYDNIYTTIFNCHHIFAIARAIELIFSFSRRVSKLIFFLHLCQFKVDDIPQAVFINHSVRRKQLVFGPHNRLPGFASDRLGLAVLVTGEFLGGNIFNFAQTNNLALIIYRNQSFRRWNYTNSPIIDSISKSIDPRRCTVEYTILSLPAVTFCSLPTA